MQRAAQEGIGHQGFAGISIDASQFDRPPQGQGKT